MRVWVISSILFPTLGFAAEKSTFSIFGDKTQFAEATCTGITGHPNAATFRLPKSPENENVFETYVPMIPPYQLVISANSRETEKTFFLTFAREDASPTFGNTYGLDLGLRIGSGMDVSCELNDGEQKTK